MIQVAARYLLNDFVGDVTDYVDTILSERTKEISDLKQELESSNRFNDYFRKLDIESAKEKDELKAEIKTLKEKLAVDEQTVLVSLRVYHGL